MEYEEYLQVLRNAHCGRQEETSVVNSESEKEWLIEGKGGRLMGEREDLYLRGPR